jgi:uncharacterized protein (DUF58 family)
VLTPRGITLLAGAGLTWLAGRTFGVDELHPVALAAAAVVLLGVLYVRLTTSAVAARRLVDVPAVVAGDDLDVVLEVRNDAAVPSPTVVVAEQVPAALPAVGHTEPGQARFVLGGVGPGKVAAVPYRLHARARGRHRLGPAVVRLGDPFGVAERTRRFTSTAEVVVYPAIERLPDAPVRGSHMGVGSSDARRVMATGEDFYTMREYVRGDDLRHVHWPSTAHRQTLMVRQMEQPWQAHATVLVDARAAAHTGGPDGTLEAAVSAAASVVYHLADRGYQLRLLTDRTTGRVGPVGWAEALERLAVLEPGAGAGLGPAVAAARGGEGLAVAVVGVPPGTGDLAQHPDLRALYGLRGFGQRVAVVVTPPAPSPGAERGERAAALLRAAGWSAATTAPGTPLAPMWAQLGRPAGRAAATAGVGL